MLNSSFNAKIFLSTIVNRELTAISLGQGKNVRANFDFLQFWAA